VLIDAVPYPQAGFPGLSPGGLASVTDINLV